MTDPTFFNLILDTNSIERYTEDYYEVRRSLERNETWFLDIKTGYYKRLTK
jgi:hypothetical protein